MTKAGRPDWWKGAAAALALFAINAYITWRLFRIEYLDEMWSIEGVYIGLARYIQEHLFDLKWFPLWYGGIPYQNTYPPLLHFLVAGFSAAAHVSPARAYHIIVAIFYCLGPVALFWMARVFGASRPAALFGGLLYSLISPSCFLVRDIRVDSGGWLGPRRLIGLVHYGDGPHVAALVLLTFAIGGLHFALEKRRPIVYFGAALALAAVVLTNWIAAFALALASGSYLLAGSDDGKSRVLRAAGVACIAYALALPWTTAATVRTIAINAPKLDGFQRTTASSAIALALFAVALLLAWVMRKIGVAARLRFAALLFAATGAITLGNYWAHIDLLPQPRRYDLEMNLAVCLAVGLLFDFIPQKRWRTAIACFGVAASLPLAIHLRHVANHLERPVDIHSTAEYKISRWLGTNLSGARVFAPGSVAFWMNAFSDTPVLSGGFANGIENQLLWGVTYEVYVWPDLSATIDWLRAFGCDAIVGDDPASRESFHPYRYPRNLHSLREIWREGPEVIYAVPRANRSLAHAIRSADLPKVAPPSYDPRPIEPYLAALDNASAPPAKFQWTTMSSAKIDTNLRPDYVLSIQVSYDPGWHALVNGEPRPIHADKLGQIVVEPHCNGVCTVDLVYDGGVQSRLARIVCIAALLGSLIWIFAARKAL